MKLALHYAVRSDKGLVRGNNEDSAYAGPRLLAIADGMGGHAGGEVASKLVIGAVGELDEDRPSNDGDIITSLREAVEDANDSLAEAVLADKTLEGMGTTLTALRFGGSTFGLVHIGDSRAYLLRDEQLTQITHDDTYVQSLVDAGRLTLEEASQHPRKSVILRALNGVTIEPDVSVREARLGDRYLLCTDGLTDVLRAETLLEALSEGDPQDCADRLVALALRGGGPDNVTCIVADVVEDGHGDDVPVVAGAVVDQSEDADAGDDSPAARAAGLSARAGTGSGGHGFLGHGSGRQGSGGHDPGRKVPVGSGSGSNGAGVALSKTRGKERRWPRVVVPVGIVVLLAAAAAGTWWWTQTQYFVGESGRSVAVFRGVNTKLGPVRFYRVVGRTAVKVEDLKPAAREQVDGGITATSRSDANDIVVRLETGQMLPLCSSLPSPVTATTAPPSPSTTPKPTLKTTPKTPVTKTTAKKTTARTSTPKAPVTKPNAKQIAARKAAAAKAARVKAAAAKAAKAAKVRAAAARASVAKASASAANASASAASATPSSAGAGASGTSCR